MKSANYQDAAVSALRDVREASRIPLVVGGTGLYNRALTQPLGLAQVAPDEAFRAQMQSYAQQHGPDALHARLAAADPETAARLHVNDIRRIIRALEVLEHTGQALSHWHKSDRSDGTALLPGASIFGLNRERGALNGIIDARVDQMLRAGWLDEVSQLRSSGYSPELKSMQSLGYRELNAHLDGKMSLEDARDSIKLHTRQFARRQLIWFRADKRIRWIDVEFLTPQETAELICFELHHEGVV